ncbi:MAG TPA: TetR/AcrR family transcriptional regulator [Solirubrobacteraceae bacterium]|nr:TetR/AcrR family transcriptional regulator [Solirubrobacteraceae bacterium]
MSTAAPAGKREQTKQANRAAILGAARTVFAEMGYGAAPVRDIVRATDLAAGTFYNYFPDKEAVFRALLEESAVRVRERTREGRSGATTLEEFVRGGYFAYFQAVAEDPMTFELTRRNAGTIRTLFNTPGIGAGVDELRTDLEAAVAAGLMPDVDIEYTAAAMVGVGFEVGVRMVAREPIDPERAADFATRLFLGGLELLRS